MDQCVVTIQYGQNQQVDLAIPQEIPNQFLAEAIAHALKLPNEKDRCYSLAILNNDGSVKLLSPASTLVSARIKCGCTLNLVRQSIHPITGAYLITESGLKFELKESNLLGHQDKNESTILDIDFGPIDIHHLISRRHATIKFFKGHYLLEDVQSKNGTWLNGKKLPPMQQHGLKNGDVISFGPPGRGLILTLNCGK